MAERVGTGVTYFSSSPDNEEKPTTYGIYGALQYARSGRIARLAWKNKGYWVEVYLGWLSLHKPDGRYYKWLIGDSDLTAGDWYVMGYDY